MVTLSWRQEKKIDGIRRRMHSLYWFLHVVMQMDMGYGQKDTKVVLGFIAMKTKALLDRIENDYKKGIDVNDYLSEDEGVMYESKNFINSRRKQYNNIRSAAELAGIKLKLNYTIRDAARFTEKYKV
jgi:hypothetical protein